MLVNQKVDDGVGLHRHFRQPKPRRKEAGYTVCQAQRAHPQNLPRSGGLMMMILSLLGLSHQGGDDRRRHRLRHRPHLQSAV